MSIIAWGDIEWVLIETQVFRLQRRIYIASLQKNRDKMHFLQRRLISSIGAKLLSVRRVTQFNKGKKAISLNRMSFLTNKEKFFIAKNLKIEGKARPIQEVKFQNSGKKPLSPSVRDQCLQQLVKFALEPEWEAKFEANSYGFRPGRSCHDAIQAIFSYSRERSLYVLEGDISKCFETISHSQLLRKLDTFLGLENQIRAWLRDGILDFLSEKKGSSIVPNNQGLFQDELISSLLVNIALHGLETDLKYYYVNQLYDGSSKITLENRRNQVSMINYGTNFIVIGPNEEKICKLKTFITRWLYQHLDLKLLEGRIVIRNSLDGYSFLGFHIITLRIGERLKCKIHISKESKTQLISKVRRIVRSNRAASSKQLIYLLNPLIISWCNYFRFSECVQDFKQIEYVIFGILRSWVFRRKSKGLRSRTKIKLKYFPKGVSVKFQGRRHTGSWIFATEAILNNNKKVVIFLVRPSWIMSEVWVKIKDTASPYDGNNIYWIKRNSKYCTWDKTIIQLVKIQSYKCAICKKSFDKNSKVEKNPITRVLPGGKDNLENLQAVHNFCNSQYSEKDIKSVTFPGVLK